jgi:rhamnosyltransferase
VDRGEVDALWNGANVGLAMALDQGLQWAADRGADWALLLDQDSRPEPGIVAEAARVIRLAGPGPVAALGAGIVGQDAGGPPGGAGWREERVVITSGTFVPVDAWRALGGFRRDFFVDYVDLEFCLRARAAGFRILRSLRPTIRHAIGRPERRRLLWRSVTVTHHDSTRRYSITRNRVVVWRAYWPPEAGFVIADVWAFAKELVKAGLFESDRPAKLRAIAAGLRDGARVPRRSG